MDTKHNRRDTDRAVAEHGGGDYWSEHALYSASEWRAEVFEGNTRAGYWDWVICQIEQEGSHD